MAANKLKRKIPQAATLQFLIVHSLVERDFRLEFILCVIEPCSRLLLSLKLPGLSRSMLYDLCRGFVEGRDMYFTFAWPNVAAVCLPKDPDTTAR